MFIIYHKSIGCYYEREGCCQTDISKARIFPTRELAENRLAKLGDWLDSEIQEHGTR